MNINGNTDSWPQVQRGEPWTDTGMAGLKKSEPEFASGSLPDFCMKTEENQPLCALSMEASNLRNSGDMNSKSRLDKQVA